MLTGIAPLPGVGKVPAIFSKEGYLVPLFKSDEHYQHMKRAREIYKTLYGPAIPSKRYKDAKKIYESLTDAERKNFDVFLKRGKSSLEEITEAEYNELLRLSRGKHKSSPTDIIPASTTIAPDGTKYTPGFNFIQDFKWKW